MNDISNRNSSTLPNENESKTLNSNVLTTNSKKVSSNIEINNVASKIQPLKINPSSNKNNVSPASVSPPNYTNGGNQQYNEPSKRKTSYNNGFTNGYGNGNGHETSNYYQSSNNNNNENCFTSVNVETIKEDFDFEQNLALFDKDAFYEEIEGHSKPVVAISNHDEPLNAYDSLIKQLNSNGNNIHNYSSSNGQSNGANDTSKQFTNQTNNQRYHQISVANLFSSTANNSIANTSKVCFIF